MVIKHKTSYEDHSPSEGSEDKLIYDCDFSRSVENKDLKQQESNNVSDDAKTHRSFKDERTCRTDLRESERKKKIKNGLKASESGKTVKPQNCVEDVEALEEAVKKTWFNHDSRPLTFTVEVDAAAIAMFLVAVITRIWRLEEPNGIVFDELHYGKFASLYMKQTFFFDSHPPLGKQLIALAGYLAGFDGNAQFDRIGGGYSSNVPVWALRIVPALFGSLLAPTMYYLTVELGLTHRTATLAGVLIIVENAFLTQSRFMLMESILIWFSVFGVLAFLKFRKEQHRPFGVRWWSWLVLCSSSLTCAVCVKYVGIFSAFLILILLAIDYWKMIGDKAVSDYQLVVHLIARFVTIVILPVCIYLSVFYIHLSILIKAGPHDNIMTSAFQASLEGGLASITKGQPLEVAHGSQITLRHTHGRACWLHSHPHVYPLRYPDKRGSSHQQQKKMEVSSSVNGRLRIKFWQLSSKIILINDLVVSEPVDKIKHGDVVQLIHGMTSRALNSHDVAAPVSPQHQEVSCYVDYNISFPAQNLWTVDIINRDTEGDIWHTIHSHVRFIHVTSGQALKFSGKQLPDWGFHQHEIVTDRVINQDDTMWNVEEHRYTKKSDQKERERDMGMAEFVPLQPTQLSFLEKMWELQYKMLTFNQENVQDHVYSSEAMDWPFLTRGIAYWVSSQSNAQIHLLGNIVTWHTATFGVLVYLILLVFYLLRRRRQCYDIPIDVWEKFCLAGQIGLCGYLFHFIPYFFADRTLFLHHYLPAYTFKLLLLIFLVEHIDFILLYIGKSWFVRTLVSTCYLIWLFAVVYTFRKLSVFSYGTTPLSAEEVVSLRWLDTWDFIIHRP